MSILSIIIRREFIAKVRNKSFIIMTFLSPLMMIGLAFFVGYLASMKSDKKTIAIHDETGLFYSEFESDEQYQYVDFSMISVSLLKDRMLRDSYEGLLLIPKTGSEKMSYISKDSPSLEFVNTIEQTIARKITNQNYAKAHLDLEAIKQAQAKVSIQLIKSSGEATVKGLNELKVGIGAGFGYLIMMFIIIYGNTVMRSVIEEKTNRIIEIIISSVKPFMLMMGKIIGNALAGLLQFMIWALLGGLLFFVLSVIFHVPLGAASALEPEMIGSSKSELALLIQTYFLEIWKLPKLTILSCFVIYFTGGYFLYSSIYAAIGAAVDSETDSQQFLLPIILPLMLGVYVGFFSVLNDPNGTVALVFSMVPLTSPIVMMMRIPFGVPWYQIVLSVVILYATFVFVVWFAAKIYRVGILMYGKKPTWKELYKWLKY